jgi:hypothetical protein
MSELAKYDALSGDVITPLNETTPNLGLNKPTVGGDDNIWGGLLNDNADVLDTTITGMRGEIAALVGVLLFIGSYDAVADHAYFTGASGFPDGPLPPASISNFNVYLIVTVGGTASGNAPPGQLVQGDWLVSDGIRWNRLALGIPPGGDIAAANVTVTPAVQGATDVQAALEQLESNYLPLTGGVMGGPLRTLGGTSAAPGLLIGGTDAGFWRLGNTVFLNAGSASPAMGWFATGITAYVPMTLSADPTAALGAATKQYVDATPALHNIGRNLLHNPLFNVAQRGAGVWTAFSVYTADRWITGGGSDAISVSLGSATDTVRTAIGDEAANSYLANTFTGNAAAAAISFLEQRMEDVRRLAGKTVTISFFAAASGALKLGVNLIQWFGTGGSPSAPVNALATGAAVTLAPAWARYSVTISVPSIVGKTLGTNSDSANWLRLYYSSGATGAAQAGNIGVQSGTIQLWGVQLEIGSVATPLEKPDPRYDLANCQRFYQVITGLSYNGYSASGTTITFWWPLIVTMRASPTLSVAWGANTNITPGLYVSGTGLYVSAASTATGQFGINLNSATASADL